MKIRMFSFMLLLVMCCMFAGCNNQPAPVPQQQQAFDQNGNPIPMAQQQHQGMDPLAAGALGAGAGFLAGKMMSRPSTPMAAPAPVVHQTIVKKTYVTRNYAPSRSYNRPSYSPSRSAFRSSGFRRGR